MVPICKRQWLQTLRPHLPWQAGAHCECTGLWQLGQEISKLSSSIKMLHTWQCHMAIAIGPAYNVEAKASCQELQDGVHTEVWKREKFMQTGKAEEYIEIKNMRALVSAGG